MESKLLQTKGIGDFSSVTVCYFGSCTPAAALGTSLPSTDSLSVSLSVRARTQNHC
jgi:hypothetical protein